ncbi:hypothetical protein WMY93_000877 [Mugilogobius chulae]|uniref:Secreted protein n=1 Tax=Mugilogobius chulae TaxID=88201 RepID=A0AAW0Q6C7_9GOBI
MNRNGSFKSLKSLLVLLLVFLCLMPTVGGVNVRGGSAGAGAESGLIRGPEQRSLPLPLPEVPDEEQEEDGDLDPSWHSLYGKDRDGEAEGAHGSAAACEMQW